MQTSSLKLYASPNFTPCISGSTENFFVDLELKLLTTGLQNIGQNINSLTYGCNNFTNISDFLQQTNNQNNTAVLGALGIVPGKDLIFSIPTNSLYFQAISYNLNFVEDSFYSFLSYFIGNSVFLAFMFLVFFGGLYIYYCEKKQNMIFKKEILVGLTLGMWHIYQIFYRKNNYNIKSITGRIFNMIIMFFFSWLTLYLICIIVINRYRSFTNRKAVNSEIFKFSEVLLHEKYLNYFSSYDFFIKTYENTMKMKDIVDFLKNNPDFALIADSLTIREILKISCDFQVISPNFRYLSSVIIMYNNLENIKAMDIINRAIISAKNDVNYSNFQKNSNFYSNNCGFSFPIFYSTFTEINQITYTNLLDVFILTISGIALAIIAVIFSKKALVYFHKKKKVKKLLKELNSSETRLLKITDIFFKKQKEKTLNILSALENDLKNFNSKEEKCLEYLQSIHDWFEGNIFKNILFTRNMEKNSNIN